MPVIRHFAVGALAAAAALATSLIMAGSSTAVTSPAHPACPPQMVWNPLDNTCDYPTSPPPITTPSPVPGVLPLSSTVQFNRWWTGSDHLAVTSASQTPTSASFEWRPGYSTLGLLINFTAPGTVPLYSCNAAGDEFTSRRSDCESQHLNSLLGYIYAAPPANIPSQAVYRCIYGTDHFDSVNSSCEEQRVDQLLGYTLAYITWNRWYVAAAQDHYAISSSPPPGATLENLPGKSLLGDLLTYPAPGTRAVYSCKYDGIGSELNNFPDEFTSTVNGCEYGNESGLLGYIYTAPPAGVVYQPVYSCMRGVVLGSAIGLDHFDSADPTCEEQSRSSLLGFTRII